jgi:hypothetical protein
VNNRIFDGSCNGISPSHSLDFFFLAEGTRKGYGADNMVRRKSPDFDISSLSLGSRDLDQPFHLNIIFTIHSLSLSRSDRHRIHVQAI